MAEIFLVRDVLDQQVLDRQKRRVGKVDGIVIEVDESGEARVLHLELGTTVVLRRVSERLARWYDSLRRRLLRHPAPPFQISWKKVREIGVELCADFDSAHSDAYHLERLLRDHLIGRIPGSSHGRDRRGPRA